MDEKRKPLSHAPKLPPADEDRGCSTRVILYRHLEKLVQSQVRVLSFDGDLGLIESVP